MTGVRLRMRDAAPDRRLRAPGSTGRACIRLERVRYPWQAGRKPLTCFAGARRYADSIDSIARRA